MNSENNAKQPYRHSSEGVGFAADNGPTPSTEHLDTTSDAGEARNELAPSERNRTADTGPRTHQDTKIDEAFRSESGAADDR